MRDVEAGTYNGETTFCTVNAYGDCPYCDSCGICHIDDPMTDCEDFAVFFQGNWDYWVSLDDESSSYDEDYEIGFDPYIGMYTDDC